MTLLQSVVSVVERHDGLALDDAGDKQVLIDAISCAFEKYGEPVQKGYGEKAAAAAIAFALGDSDGLDFLRLWQEGEFDIIREEWPDAPEAVFIGADPLYENEKMKKN